MPDKEMRIEATTEKEDEIRELSMEAMAKAVGGVGKPTAKSKKDEDGEGILLPEI